MKDARGVAGREREEVMEIALVGAMAVLAVLVLSDSIINRLGHKH